LSHTPEDLFKKTFPFLILGAFVLLGFIGILNHEMWRDEVQAWLIAKDCPDIWTALQIIKYEGHPALWYVCLHFLSKLTPDLFSLQLFHLLIAAVSVFVFAVFAPFSKLQKALFAFGYFPLYEYGIISRHYAIGILFIFALCALYPRRRNMYAPIGLLLALLANSNVYGTIIAISFFSTLVLDFFLMAKRDTGGEFSKIGAIVGSGIFLLGLIVAVEQMIPRQDSCFAAGWHLFFHARHFVASVSTLAVSYIPLPDMQAVDFWNSNFLASFPEGEAIMPVVSLVLAICCVALLSRVPVALFLYLSSTAGVVLFTYLVYFGSLRHHGHLFIILVMSFWIASLHDSATEAGRIKSNTLLRQKFGRILLTGLLCLHVVSGAFALCTDFRYPFSAGRSVAQFIKSLGLPNVLVAGDGPHVTTVGAYLNKPVYFADRNRFGTFVVFDRQLSTPQCPQLVAKLKHLGKTLNTDVILVLNHEIPCSVPDVKILPLLQITETIVPDERAYLYLLKQTP
jgi:hypothetical protein